MDTKSSSPQATRATSRRDFLSGRAAWDDAIPDLPPDPPLREYLGESTGDSEKTVFCEYLQE